MRLSPKETQAIRQVLLNEDPQGRIFLFGSRINDEKKAVILMCFLNPQKKWDSKQS
jgi:hypothetical protein